MTPKKPTPRKASKPAQKPETSAKPVPISLDAIMLDGLTQSRTRTDPEVVEQYAEALREGVEFPPVDLFTEDNRNHYIGDGIHRCDAHVVAKRASIKAIIHQGGLHEAQIFACSANKTHGLYRSNADKRHAVARMLELEGKWSNAKIAEHVGVSRELVADVRKTLENENTIQPMKAREGRDGKSYDTPAPQTPKKTGKKAQGAESAPCADAFDPASIESDESGVDVAALAEPYKRAVNDINRIIREIGAEAAEEKTGAYLADKIVRVVKDLESAKAAIRMMEPVDACPDCVGGCKKCANSGFITRMMAESRKA